MEDKAKELMRECIKDANRLAGFNIEYLPTNHTECTAIAMVACELFRVRMKLEEK